MTKGVIEQPRFRTAIVILIVFNYRQLSRASQAIASIQLIPYASAAVIAYNLQARASRTPLCGTKPKTVEDSAARPTCRASHVTKSMDEMIDSTSFIMRCSIRRP